MRWEHGDPKLPVAREMEELKRTFRDIFHYQVASYDIQEEQCHLKVSQVINSFVLHNGDSKNDLKIFYYAGHSRLGKSKDLLFSGYEILSTSSI